MPRHALTKFAQASKSLQSAFSILLLHWSFGRPSVSMGKTDEDARLFTRSSTVGSFTFLFAAGSKVYSLEKMGLVALAGVSHSAYNTSWNTAGKGTPLCLVFARDKDLCEPCGKSGSGSPSTVALGEISKALRKHSIEEVCWEELLLSRCTTSLPSSESSPSSLCNEPSESSD